VRTFKRVAGLNAIVTALTMAAAGCSSSGSGRATGDDDSSYTIGVVRFASSDPASESILNAYVDYAEGQDWEVSAVDSQGAPDKAISGIENYVQKNVDLIVVGIFPSDALAAGVRQAEAAGIPVVSVGGGTSDGVQASLDFGRSNAEDTSRQLIDDLGGQGEVLVLGYQQGLPCLGREEEFMAQVEATDIQITREEVPIPGAVEAGTQFTQAWLATRAKGEGPLAIWGCFGDPALGAIAALKQANRSDVLVYGHDGSPAAIQAVKSGDLRATSFFDPAAEGGSLGELTPQFIEDGVDAEAQELSPTMHLVTPDSINDFLEQFPEAAG
jgi:ribose transport system substrate-binding protein